MKTLLLLLVLVFGVHTAQAVNITACVTVTGTGNIYTEFRVNSGSLSGGSVRTGPTTYNVSAPGLVAGDVIWIYGAPYTGGAPPTTSPMTSWTVPSGLGSTYTLSCGTISIAASGVSLPAKDVRPKICNTSQRVRYYLLQGFSGCQSLAPGQCMTVDYSVPSGTAAYDIAIRAGDTCDAAAASVPGTILASAWSLGAAGSAPVTAVNDGGVPSPGPIDGSPYPPTADGLPNESTTSATTDLLREATYIALETAHFNLDKKAAQNAHADAERGYAQLHADLAALGYLPQIADGVAGINVGVGATGTKLDTLHSDMQYANARALAIEGYQSGMLPGLYNIETKVGVGNTTLGTIASGTAATVSRLDSANGYLSAISTATANANANSTSIKDAVQSSASSLTGIKNNSDVLVTKASSMADNLTLMKTATDDINAQTLSASKSLLGMSNHVASIDSALTTSSYDAAGSAAAGASAGDAASAPFTALAGKTVTTPTTITEPVRSFWEVDFGGGLVGNFDPMAQTWIVSTASWTTTVITWGIAATMLFLTSTQVQKLTMALSAARQAQSSSGVPLLSSAAGFIAAGLITAAIYVAPVALIAYLNGSSVSAFYNTDFRPSGGALQQGYWLLTRFVPIPLLIGAVTSYAALRFTGQAAFNFSAAVIRFVVPCGVLILGIAGANAATIATVKVQNLSGHSIYVTGDDSKTFQLPEGLTEWAKTTETLAFRGPSGEIIADLDASNTGLFPNDKPYMASLVIDTTYGGQVTIEESESNAAWFGYGVGVAVAIAAGTMGLRIVRGLLRSSPEATV